MASQLTLDTYLASTKQKIPFTKTGARTTLAVTYFSTFDLAGNPGAGVLAVGNTANGISTSSGMAGFPVINTFGATNKGYLTGVEYGSNVGCRMLLFDRLFSAGAFAFNANVTLSSQPSYSSRVPNGTDYKGTQLWLECVTANTGVQSVNVTYLNQDGVSKSTGTIATAANTVGRWYHLPLAAGDSGIQSISSVVGSVATAGTFNIHVIRPLWMGRVKSGNDGGNHGIDLTGAPEVFQNSALQVIINTDSTAIGIPDLIIEVSNL